MDTKTANRVSTVTIIMNLALSVLKFVVGFAAHSQALISDAVHSASDVVSTIAVIFGINLASKKSDDEHQYGHERIESVFSIILAMMLFATGVGIGISAARTIINGGEIAVPGRLALGAAFVSIVVKEWMYHYTKRAAKKIKSSAMLADAWHHRSDALSSVGSLIGIGGALLGYPIFEPAASIVICVFIVKAAYDIFMQAVNCLVDRACDTGEVEALRNVILDVKGVRSIDVLRTRKFGSKIYVDVEISEDGNLSLYKAHKIAEQVHDRVEAAFPDVKHCMIHVNPVNNEIS
ncbi:MAG: cation transporter [Oscillospiraceae bacterium]|nr:cation transporter [Oscillospiraceae bacterium]